MHSEFWVSEYIKIFAIKNSIYDYIYYIPYTNVVELRIHLFFSLYNVAPYTTTHAEVPALLYLYVNVSVQ